jgi:hypothetical protein
MPFLTEALSIGEPEASVHSDKMLFVLDSVTVPFEYTTKTAGLWGLSKSMVSSLLCRAGELVSGKTAAAEEESGIRVEI